MKKALFLILLLPFIGLSQTTLVRWKGQNGSSSATTYDSNVTAGNMTATGASLTVDTWNGFQMYNWNLGNGTSNPTLNPDKYIQLTVSPASGYNITLDKFKFRHNRYNNDSPKKLTIKYSLNSNFSNASTLIDDQNIPSGYVDKDPSFNGLVVPAGSTLYIRVYAYDNQNTGWSGGIYRFAHVDGNGNYDQSYGEGPAITGTVAAAGGVSAAADAASVVETQSVNINVLSNDTFATGVTPGSVTIFTSPSAGTATVQPDKSITFTAPTVTTATNYTFVYKVTASDNTSSNGTVTVTVTPYASPVVTNFTKTTGVGVAVTTNVFAAATAGSGTISPSGVSIVGAATNGTATVNATTGVITYVPNSGTAGQTGVVTYKITNSNNKSTNGTITVAIQAVVAPTANADSYSVAKNTATELSVYANDVIGSGAFSSLIIATQPAHGSVAITNSNKITYTPETGYTGADSFTYKVKNTYNATSTAGTVSLTVVNQPVSGALCGTYTVGVGGNYATITAAVNALNANGVACNVTFSLINGSTKPYNIANGESFPITINSFTNPNNAYTVTFKPASGKNPVVSAGNIGDTWSPAATAFKINGADNIIFDGSNTVNGTTRNLILANGDKTLSTDRAIIWVASNGSDGAKNITVKNTVIKMIMKNADYAYATGIFSGNNTFTNNNLVNDTATADNSGLTVINNDFVNVKQGIYVNGGSSLITNVNITGNDLGAENNTETVVEPSRLNNVKDFVYTENLIYNLHRESAGASLVSSGIYVSGNSSNGTITKNNIRDLYKTLDEGHYFAGIVLNSSNTNNNILVANNFILNVSGYAAGGNLYNGNGITVVTGGGYKIYNNTVSLNTNSYNNGNGITAALMVNMGVTNLDVRNNIFLNNQTVGYRSAIFVHKANETAISTIFSNLDYNDYYCPGKTAYIGDNPTWASYDNTGYITTFDAWKTATGKDANSKNVNPVFASASDMHINVYSSQNNDFADAGTNAVYTTVGKDIDGQVRKANTPDMGADEFGPGSAVIPGNDEGIYCDSATTFTGYVNGVAQWTNGAPAIDKDVIFNADYTQTGGLFYACSVYVIDGKSVNFINNATATVQHTVNVADTGALTFESGSNLIQVEDEQNSGAATVKRKGGLLKRLDYTLWGSPVTGTQTLTQFSPLTSATNPSRFYKYDTANDYYATITNPAETKFEKGKSILIRMPNSLPNSGATAGYNAGTTRFQFEGAFYGTPNNGTVRVALDYVNRNFNSVGNPYASPISIPAFLQENAVNAGVIDGTVWLWRKTNDSNIASYATCTIDTYAANSAGNNDGNTMLADPNGILNTGQGFLVKALAANKDLVFRNNMRADSHSATFFKTQNTNEGPQAVQSGKVWINVKQGANFSQAALSYNDYTSLNYDNGYDGLALLGGTLSVYSFIPAEQENLKLTIQSRGEFNDADVVPMGYIATAAGTYEFEIDHAQGIFAEGQDVYVIDNLLGTSHNLNNGTYSFTTDAGTFESRFSVAYMPQGELGTNNPVVDAKQVIVYREGQQVKVTAPEEISSVTVYDMLGRTLFTQNDIANTEFATAQLNIAQQVVIVNVTLSNKQVVSQKIMMN